METFHVAAEQQGTRLDKFLIIERPDLSRSFLQTLVEEGGVRVNGGTSKSNYKVKAGDSITLEVPPPAPTQALPEELPLDILYEDEDMVVLNKAAGMVVHPAAGHAGGTLVNAVLGHMPDLVTGNRERPGIVHRLDRDTSGVILVAKNDAALHELQRQFAAREVQKTYLALVTGAVKTPEGKIDAPLERDPRNRKKIAVGAGSTARQSVTNFKVLEQTDKYALMLVTPETGRTHQIRAHLAFIKHPVAADPVYGKKKNDLGLERQFLHAWRIAFTHPRTGVPVSFSAPLPADLQAALECAGLPPMPSDG